MKENCRVCLTNHKDSLCNLTDIRNEGTVADILAFVCGIEILLGGQLPNKVCNNCLDQLMSASDLKHRVINTEEILQAQIKDETILRVDPNDYKVLPTEFKHFPPEDLEKLVDELNVIKERTPRKSSRKPKKTEPKESSRPSQDTTERKNKTPNEMDYKCFLCEKKFEKIWSKNNHVKVDHEAERICKLCQMKCKTPLSLETHVKFHFRDYGFMCEICSKTFRYKNRLNGHMALHHSKGVEMIACDLCGLSTKFKNNIKRHMKSVHMKLREFQCDQCSAHQYSTQEALNSHKYRYHNVQAPIKCPDCQHGFTFDSELRAHKKHGFCSKNPNAQLLRRGKTRYEHWELMDETGEHVCKLCNEVFPTKNKWSMHNYLKHKYSNKCDTCNIVFTNYTSLIRHEKVKHQGYKPFKCEFCPKCFGQKVSLISHRNTHTGEKSFGCPFCPFRSGDHGTVSKHKKKIHPEMLVSTSKASI